MPTLLSRPGTSRTLLALFLAGATLASATLVTAQERQRGGGQLPADHPQTEQQQRPPEQRPAPPGPGVLRLLPGDSVTQHSIEVAGRKLDYRRHPVAVRSDR
jgi:hypothetical protein